ncbi:hypothetical protein FPV67DRAFT_1666768 [Lyophyllum atratum]|nr:hypothetical protein FPV67DRAFT_1666768 [Lyophyllum atratum]
MSSLNQATFPYNVARKYFSLNILSGSFVTFSIDAPFGLRLHSILDRDGVGLSPPLSLHLHHLPALVVLQLQASESHPPHNPFSPPSTSSTTQNRAILSPLRTPSCSKSHLIFPLVTVASNTINVPSWTPTSPPGQPPPITRSRLLSCPTFVLGAALWPRALRVTPTTTRSSSTSDARPKPRKSQGKPEQGRITPSSKAGRSNVSHSLIACQCDRKDRARTRRCASPFLTRRPALSSYPSVPPRSPLPIHLDVLRDDVILARNGPRTGVRAGPQSHRTYSSSQTFCLGFPPLIPGLYIAATLAAAAMKRSAPENAPVWLRARETATSLLRSPPSTWMSLGTTSFPPASAFARHFPPALTAPHIFLIAEACLIIARPVHGQNA